jgi:hypothetical protein|tara:strand:- start:703 stop:969 length:267 start_codon:yes stop_codon:yes gene_type:complete
MQNKDDIEKLKKAGVLSKKSSDELEKTGGISKKRTSIKRFLKTADGKWVTPTLYYRGGLKSKPSKKQIELTNKVNTLITKYTIERKNA